MRRFRVWITLCCGVSALAVIAWAQGRKAGLYEVTTTTTWQQSPFPAGMGPGAAGGPRTNQVCVTQEQIDKYNGTPPQIRSECQVSNVVKKTDGFTADVACSGRMATKGTVEGTYTADGHGKTKVHLLGNVQMGSNSKPVEMTIESESSYKGADCGSVKPIDVSAK